MTDFVFHPGDLVESKCGRDAGRVLFVISVQDGFLTLCDGRTRRVEQPKRKKPKHVSHIVRPDGTLTESNPGDTLYKTAEKIRTGSAVTNSELRRALNAFMDAGSGNGFNVRRDADVKG